MGGDKEYTANLWTYLVFCHRPKNKVCLILIIYILKKWYVGKWVLTITLHNPVSSVDKEYACNVSNPSLIPGWGRSAEEGTGYTLQYSWASLGAQLVKNLSAIWETWVQSLGWEDTLEKGMATHSSILAWRIPWTA